MIPLSKVLATLAVIGVAPPMIALGAGCAADPPATGTDDAGASTTADGATGARDGATTTVDAAVAPDDGSVDAGAVDASAACVAYCGCLATNCPTKTIPGGCLAACSVQTKWDLNCRTGMCNVAKGEPNNNHCDLAVGVSECLDKP